MDDQKLTMLHSNMHLNIFWYNLLHYINNPLRSINMLVSSKLMLPQGVRAHINAAYRIDELKLITELIDKATLSTEQITAIEIMATNLIQRIRQKRRKNTGID